MREKSPIKQKLAVTYGEGFPGGELGSNIVDIVHQRIFAGSSVRATLVELSLQMRGEEQIDQVVQGLRQRDYEVDLSTN